MDMMERHSKIARMVKGIMATKKSTATVQEKVAQRLVNNMPYSDYVTCDHQGGLEEFRLNKDLRRHFNITNDVGT